MKNMYLDSRQGGATLIVGLIMLVVITLLVVSAFTLSSGNLKAVGNMQFRDEAIAAANIAIEQTINVNFAAVAQPATVNVDIDQDNVIDYVVSVAAPSCIKATPAAADPSSLSGVNSNIANSSDYQTLWEISATVTSQATGASAVVRQGISKRLTQAQYSTSACI